ncbi:hypothetical protein BN1051_01451 [Arthrobacter saudimassiliensis]|uniref:Uncharacterized protein n=1 Tax=Arthrobacter saudimassiliensis TaxID=1461584 RepID=A0A078MLF6_9MICC|nr:hypothetical protein BN1051_01451 [Arthrobacter saudimassiliensis]
MREQLLQPEVRPHGGAVRTYEYLVISVSPDESLPEARARVAEHAEYGKWELHRSCIYQGGGRRFWLRRRVMRVVRTA